MPYLELSFSPVPSEPDRELLMAELLQAGFDSFNEEEQVLRAYIPAGSYRKEILDGIGYLADHPQVSAEIRPLEDINWNKEWESNYQPVTLDNKCLVRAPFHTSVPGMQYDIIIEPKMAFGTAHHETTRLMAGRLMEMDVPGRQVLDMGCGTGILAILANKMGAKSVTGIDNDEWAWRNCEDNFRVNGIYNGQALLGDASLVVPDGYDIILANINRNVLLQDMSIYAEGLRKGGILLMSGFYEKDIEAIVASATGAGLDYKGSKSLNQWAVVMFTK